MAAIRLTSASRCCRRRSDAAMSTTLCWRPTRCCPTSEEVAEHLWRRLKLIAVEDVGMGAPMAPVLLEVLYGHFKGPSPAATR